ncbi:MAG: sulfur transferase domain-containing protein, partial [Gemmatimonadales bacterium]
MSTAFQAVSGVANACQILPNVVTGGQPTAEQLKALKAAGGEIVLDLRDPMEPRPVDEAALVRELGMEYVNIPVRAGSLDDATLEHILTVLRSAGNRPVFFHCGSGSRVGGALIPYFILDQGLEEQDAVDQAMRVGLRSAEYMEWGLDYARPSPPAPLPKG